MKLRPYIASTDFEEIKNWVTDERAHAMWCAGLIDYPIDKISFHATMDQLAGQFGEKPYAAVSDDGQLIGFFCYSINPENNEGFFRCIMNNPAYRGKGYGKMMLDLAVKYAFEITKVDSIQLNVFPQNESAKRCYEAVGFTERRYHKFAFFYRNEIWDKCNMVIRK